jgi:hypothetical protein
VYTDPGSGLFFIQLIAAAILTAGYRLRRLILAPFASKRSEDENCEN